MMKVILKLEFADEKTKQKAMKKVSGLSGLESISFDAKDRKLTVTGTIDPIVVVAKLRKICPTEIVSVGPAKEPEKKKADDPKKEDPKNVEDRKKEEMLKAYQAYYQQMQNPYYYQPQQAAPPSYPGYYQRSVDEDPNSCVIS